MAKNILQPFMLILSVYFSSAQNTPSSQTITNSWTWDSYKIGFNAPTDLVVKESSATVFYAGNDHVFLSIYPKKGENLKQDKLQPALQKWATDNKVNFSLSNITTIAANSRFWSYYISGSSYKGMPAYAAIIVDSLHPEDSYYVWLQYQNGYAEVAMNILNSFSTSK